LKVPAEPEQLIDEASIRRRKITVLLDVRFDIDRLAIRMLYSLDFKAPAATSSRLYTPLSSIQPLTSAAGVTSKAGL
jgi:hypothetical protein